MKIIIKKDWEWFLAEVEGQDNIFAYWNTKESAKKELLWVVEMMMDYHLEQVNDERIIRNELIHAVEEYAVQI